MEIRTLSLGRGRYEKSGDRLSFVQNSFAQENLDCKKDGQLIFYNNKSLFNF